MPKHGKRYRGIRESAPKETLELEDTVFRSDHASNYLVLKGTLSRDKARLLEMVRTAIRRPGEIPLRQEWQRGL